MAISRQEAFQKLRTPCVELSSVALQFKANQATTKQVLSALNNVFEILNDLSTKSALDQKLAEYAFFPLTHILNESKRLSSSCLEVTVNCVTILVTQGWRQHLLPAMGRQLLILMTLITGSDSSTTKGKPSEDLLVACFNCVKALVHWTSTSQNTSDGDPAKSVTDQIVYFLLETIMTSSSDTVQIAAAGALAEVFSRQKDHLLLASLLPRTVSGLTKVLKPSTQARRTQNVLSEYLKLLRSVLRSILADSLVLAPQQDTSVTPQGSSSPGLDPSWLNATAPQVAIALIHVTRLRTSDGSKVRGALFDLCLMVVQDCSGSLSESLPLMLETMVFLAGNSDLPLARETIEHLVTYNSELGDLLRAKLYEWSRALPRLMLANDDRARRDVLSEISTSFEILSKTMQMQTSLIGELGATVQNALVRHVENSSAKLSIVDIFDQNSSLSLVSTSLMKTSFPTLLLNHQSQRESLRQMQELVQSFQNFPGGSSICREWVDGIADGDRSGQLSAAWLALQFLQSRSEDLLTMEDFVDASIDGQDLTTSRPYLVSDLYSVMLPYLLEFEPMNVTADLDCRIVASSLECVILQAQQLGESYRPELVDTLYPILAVLASSNQFLQNHAITSLNLLAAACSYESVADMLVQNVDYLVNSVALKLNAFDVSPPAIKVVQMMLRLCGSRLLPYLDDLVGSIFGALDNFHGYPAIVESLFGVLKTMVDESAKIQPKGIMWDDQKSKHRRRAQFRSSISDILGDISIRKHKRYARQEEGMDNLPLDDRHGNFENANNRQSGTADDTEPSSTISQEIDGGTLKTSASILLTIAKATNPHLTSPSPQARQTLLQLLAQVTPLLSVDENAFLPFVNEIWPNVVTRLFQSVDDHAVGSEVSETVYNICTAASVVGALCEGAGDFMSSRIEALLPRLEKEFLQTYGQYRSRLGTKGDDWQMERQDSSNTASALRTGDTQILSAFSDLLSMILLHVRVDGDTSERIFNILGLSYVATQKQTKLRSTLVSFNADAVWLMSRQAVQRPESIRID